MLVARDDEAALAEALDAAARAADLVVSTGGVGPGTHDLAGRFAAATPGGMLARVAMRPGRPQAHGTWNGTPWLALPGNPTAAFVSFEAAVFVWFVGIGYASRRAKQRPPIYRRVRGR